MDKKHITPIVKRSRNQESNSARISPFSIGDDSLTILAEDMDINNGKIDFQIPQNNKTQISKGERFNQNRSKSSISLGSPGKTMRDYDETIKNLQKENFDLKLRIFLLEERCSKRTNITEKESSEEYLVHQLETCRKSLTSCIALVEEASAAIDILEHQLEAEKDEHEKEVKKFEKTVLKYEKDFNLLSEDSINNNVKTKEKDPSQKMEICKSNCAVQCDLPQAPAVQEAYYESVRLYRTVVGRLEGKLRTQVRRWKSVHLTAQYSVTCLRHQQSKRPTMRVKGCTELWRSEGKLRVNPLFQDDDPHIEIPSQGLSKNCDLYRTSSCSSGYGSSISQEQLGNMPLSFISKEDKAHPRQKHETGNLLIPPPIWPGLGRIHSWLQFDEINKADTKQLVSVPEDELQIVDNPRVIKDCSDEADKTSWIASEKRKHCGHSRGIHSVGRHEAKSKENQDFRKFHQKHALSLPKHKQKKIGKALTYQMTISGTYDRFAEPDMKKSGKEKLKNAREQRSSSPKYMDIADLSANNLSDPLSHPDSQFKQTRVKNQSLWLPTGRDEIDSSLYPWTHLDQGHGVWIQEKWRHQLSSTAGYQDESEEKEKNNSYMLDLCKSFCFLLVLTTFVMVIVTVSVFLSRGARQLRSSM